MYISHREAFIGKRDIKTPSRRGHDFIRVYDDNLNITPAMKPYPKLFRVNKNFLTPGNYSEVYADEITLRASGSSWSPSPYLYYSPSLDISARFHRDNPDDELLDRVYQKLSEAGLPVTENVKLEL